LLQSKLLIEIQAVYNAFAIAGNEPIFGVVGTVVGIS
jgi:hypothetical protein